MGVYDYKNKNLKNELNNRYQINEYNYKYKVSEIDNINNSINLNKPFHNERKHFPLLNNRSNFFKNITPFMAGYREKNDRNNLIKGRNYIKRK